MTDALTGWLDTVQQRWELADSQRTPVQRITSCDLAPGYNVPALVAALRAMTEHRLTGVGSILDADECWCDCSCGWTCEGGSPADDFEAHRVAEALKAAGVTQ